MCALRAPKRWLVCTVTSDYEGIKLKMGKFWLIIIMLILIGIGVGAVYLMTADIEPPKEHVEKTLPDDRFPQ